MIITTWFLSPREGVARKKLPLDSGSRRTESDALSLVAVCDGVTQAVLERVRCSRVRTSIVRLSDLVREPLGRPRDTVTALMAATLRRNAGTTRVIDRGKPALLEVKLSCGTNMIN